MACFVAVAVATAVVLQCYLDVEKWLYTDTSVPFFLRLSPASPHSPSLELIFPSTSPFPSLFLLLLSFLFSPPTHPPTSSYTPLPPLRSLSHLPCPSPPLPLPLPSPLPPPLPSPLSQLPHSLTRLPSPPSPPSPFPGNPPATLPRSRPRK